MAGRNPLALADVLRDDRVEDDASHVQDDAPRHEGEAQLTQRRENRRAERERSVDGDVVEEILLLLSAVAGGDVDPRD